MCNLSHCMLLIILAVNWAKAAPYYTIGDPKFRNDPNGHLYGVPVVGYLPCSETQVPQAKFLIPVEHVRASLPESMSEDNIYSVGLYQPERFVVGCEDLETFVSKHNVPNYIKFVVLNSKNE